MSRLGGAGAVAQLIAEIPLLVEVKFVYPLAILSSYFLCLSAYRS